AGDEKAEEGGDAHGEEDNADLGGGKAPRQQQLAEKAESCAGQARPDQPENRNEKAPEDLGLQRSRRHFGWMVDGVEGHGVLRSRDYRSRCNEFLKPQSDIVSKHLTPIR